MLLPSLGRVKVANLLLWKNGRLFGYEIKRVDAPRLTKSMQMTLEALELERLTVVYPGNRAYPLGEKVMVEPVTAVLGNYKMAASMP